ncbi:MAG: hypothetical protein R3C56_21115 [Pirellulaceae bacterium]
MWVADLAEVGIPSDNMQVGLLMLQSLLIHDRLTAAELAATVPDIQCSNVLKRATRCGNRLPGWPRIAM